MPTCKDCLHLEVCAYFKADLPYCVDFKDSAEWVERPKGRWVLDERTGVISCPYCKHLTAIVGNNKLYEEAVYEHNFCSFCGADMRGESE